jgi:hypothetical protein
MMTPLDKPLRRELHIDGQPYLSPWPLRPQAG